MDLRQLGYFIAVAEELSFSRAAVRVNISQPPLSRQIAKLEQDLGATLLRRSPHAVTLTPAGEALLVEARRLVSMSKTIGDVVRRADRGETGALRVAFVGSTIYTSVPTLLGQYRKAFPHVDVSLRQATVARQVELLKHGELDVGIIRQPVSDRKLATRTLFKEAFMAALPVDHRLADLTRVQLKALAREPFVAFSRAEAPNIHAQLRRMCETAGFMPHIVQEAYPMSTVVGLVAAGVGIAIVPESMKRLQYDNIVYRELGGTRERSEFFLVWRHGDDSQTLKGFLATATH